MKISIAGKNEELELKGKEQLERLFKLYDLSKYFFCEDITFESFVMPASHPTIFLNTRYVEGSDDDSALASFIHEELHWFLNSKDKEIEKAVEELKQIYEKVPIGFPEGAKSEKSTYQHLLLNTLEFEGIKELIGIDRAKEIIKKKNYYKWIYKKVLEDNTQLLEILEVNNLII
jgi:hypothetical protein